MQSVTPKQIKLIHVLAQKCGLDEDLYRAKLSAQYGVSTCKNLTYNQAIALIHSLGGYYHPDMDRPKNRASAKQLALIRAEWAKISNQRSEKDRELALLKICKKVAGVDMLEWMSAAQTNKLIAALRKWRKSEAA